MIKLSPYEKIDDQFIDPQCIQIPALYLGEENQPQVAQREIEIKTLKQREKEDHPGRNSRIRRLQTKEPHRWT